MIVNTKYFGEMEVTDDDKIRFPEPLPGFENFKEFIIIRFYEDTDSILCLQSLDDQDLAFVIMNPFYIVENYTPVLSNEDRAIIKAGDKTPLSFYAIAVVHDYWQDSTVNLKCPIVFNTENGLAKQIIMDDTAYSMRHPIAAETRKEV